jgi:hypothetical protein
MAPRLLTLGCVLLAISLFCWHEGSGWGLFIAWVSGTWGATLAAWALIAGWHKSLAACIAGSAFALGAALTALFFVQRDAWEIAVVCAVGSGLALAFGLYQVHHLAEDRLETRGSEPPLGRP